MAKDDEVTSESDIEVDVHNMSNIYVCYWDLNSRTSSKKLSQEKMREQGFKNVITSFTRSSKAMDKIQETLKHPTNKTGVGFCLNPSSTSQHDAGFLSLDDKEL